MIAKLAIIYKKVKRLVCAQGNHSFPKDLSFNFFFFNLSLTRDRDLATFFFQSFISAVISIKASIELDGQVDTHQVRRSLCRLFN